MASIKNLSNPFSTGGGGTFFEAQIQALYVILMLSGGHAPHLPCFPIKKINLQGKIDGYNTDDIIVHIQDPVTNNEYKMLGQIKHSISFTNSSAQLEEVMLAAWNDYHNNSNFIKGKDIIALITGPLSATDQNNVQWLLNKSRHTTNVDEFLQHVNQSNFSPSKCVEKLNVFHYHLKKANKGKELNDNEIYDFLKHLYVIGYDLDYKEGVIHSLAHSYISQFHDDYPEWLWSEVVTFTQTYNQSAGTITIESIPERILNIFEKKNVRQIPENLYKIQEKKDTFKWNSHDDAIYLALLSLVGSWSEKSSLDKKTIENLLGISYAQLTRKIQLILHMDNSPLKFTDGIWTLNNRVDMIQNLGNRILDVNIDNFLNISLDILSEINPAFDLKPEERFSATIYNKKLKYSDEIRKSVAEGLAIINSNSSIFSNCTFGNVKSSINSTVYVLLNNHDWRLWGSINDLLPFLAEASPKSFIKQVEYAFKNKTNPFAELFSQEGSGITGRNYLTGLLWALEALAWSEEMLVQVSIILAKLANIDPGGQWSNRPINSIIEILLPWYPQTLASEEKRYVVLKTIYNEHPDIAWKINIQLLPNKYSTTTRTHKPKWFLCIPDDYEKSITKGSYWNQITNYSNIAIAQIAKSMDKLQDILEELNNLPPSSYDELIRVIHSSNIEKLSEPDRFPIWNTITTFIRKHLRFKNSDWALSSDKIKELEDVASSLAPSNPIYLYQYLFIDNDWDLYENIDEYDQQHEILLKKRDTSVDLIYNSNELESVIYFAENVSSSYKVGFSLGSIFNNNNIDIILFSNHLNSDNSKIIEFMNGFIWRRHILKGWEWFDDNFSEKFSVEEIARILTILPFIKETWDRVNKYLKDDASLYWSFVRVNPYESKNNTEIAVKNFLKYKRPYSAIQCLEFMNSQNYSINNNMVLQALYDSISSKEVQSSLNTYHTTQLITYLQSQTGIVKQDLINLEWAYLPLLYSNSDSKPITLENQLSIDPSFYCEVIQLLYRSENDKLANEKIDESKKLMANNAWHLLNKWSSIPGKIKRNIINEQILNEWFLKVEKICVESGHFSVAMVHIGHLFVHAPSDPDGL